MSETMRAVVIDRFGGPEVLQIRDVPCPLPARDEIRVRVRSSGLNRADLSQRRGRYPAPHGSPADIPGLEFAGTVESAGSDVRLWEPGDPVMGIVGGGGYAEYVVTHERAAVKVPDGTSLVDAGAIPEVFMTAYDALFRQMGLAAGETLLIHAVGSGVGTAALQLAKANGARSIGTSRTQDKVRQAIELGLSVGITAGDDWPEQVLEATHGRGVDVILDLVGGAYLRGNLDVLAGGGRQVVVGVPSGSEVEIDLRILMMTRATVRGTVLRARPLEEKIALARDFEATVVGLFERALLAPVVDCTLPAAKVVEAHHRMEENRNFGKILLLWDD